MHWAQLWQSSRLAALMLSPLSFLYALGWEIYLLAYRLGFKRASEPHKPVVCVGNLQVGGTGKTPVVVALAKLLISQGRRVVVSCSGYGSPASKDAMLAPEGDLSAHEWGDEPAMFRMMLPGVPLIVGRNRVRAAQICAEMLPDAVLLLDDGFQHLPLKKHVSIILDPPIWNRFCLPAGPYREPVWNRSRADLVVPGEFKVQYTPLSFVEARTGAACPKPERANVLCALGDPNSFVWTLESQGVEVVNGRLLPDHDTLLAGNLFDGLDPALPLVVTAKDWGKLRQRSDLEKWSLLIANREASIQPAGQFSAWLAKKLDGDSSQS